MKITDVKVFPVDEEKLKAYATITFENCFIVRDLKVISGNKGYFIAMPSKKRKDGTFRDVAHPLNSETRKMIEEAVLEVYEKEVPASEAAPFTSETEPETPGPEEAPPDGSEEQEASEPEAASPDGSEEQEASEPEAASPDGSEEQEASEPDKESSSDDEPGSRGEQGADEPVEAPVEQVEAAQEDTSEISGTPETEPEKDSTKDGATDITPPEDPEKAFGYEE